MKLLKNKRGMAMESAILFMLIVFMFGLLLTGVAMTSHLRVNVNNTLLSRELEIEQIGENFVYSLDVFNDPKDDTITIGNYNAKLGVNNNNNNNKTLTLTRNNKVVLYVEVDDNKAIKVWKYSNEDNKNG